MHAKSETLHYPCAQKERTANACTGQMATNAASSVQTLLLQEAQQEIAVLRTDLYNTRRLAEERRQSEQALQAAQASLKAQVEQLTTQLEVAQAAALRLPGAEEQARKAEQLVEQLQKDLDLSLRARRILENELVHERKDKDKLAAEKAGLEVRKSVDFTCKAPGPVCKGLAIFSVQRKNACTVHVLQRPAFP